MWLKAQDMNSNYPLFVNQAIKLFNLQQVAFEIENSVLSKVSCTACKGNRFLKFFKIQRKNIHTKIGMYITYMQNQQVIFKLSTGQISQFKKIQKNYELAVQKPAALKIFLD
jgi:predicted metal-binding protein